MQARVFPRDGGLLVARYRHLTHDQVWERVREFAVMRVEKRLPVFTLQRKVRNFITDVKVNSIGRQSDEGVSNTSRVGRSAVGKVWEDLLKNGMTKGPAGVLYFTPALMLAAMPDTIEYVGDGEIALRGHPHILERDRRRLKRLKRAGNGEGHAGGEGELHRALKEFIFNRPDIALRSLGPGPYAAVKVEYTFLTGDRVDVVLLDAEGNILLIEVKPSVSVDDLSPWAQAKKYRALWSVFEDRAENEIRCIVAAPKIPERFCGRMLRDHRVESVVVRLPGKFG